MRRPVLAWLTDFGSHDHYVAAMKGVALGICPDAALLDITHEIAPQDVLGGALELEAVAPFLPTGTVVVGVVDPGVGSARRGIIVESRGLFFVGPDNGLFSLAVDAATATIVELASRDYARSEVSATFEGRDRFAPAAAWLATGVPPSAFGPVSSTLVSLDLPGPITTSDGLSGVVMRIDRFGNLVTNITRSQIASVSSPVAVWVGGRWIDGVSRTFSDVARGEPCAVIGSTERLEICVNGGHAAHHFAVGRGGEVRVRSRSGA
jgi:S-adenosylmethionine hydrolase